MWKSRLQAALCDRVGINACGMEISEKNHTDVMIFLTTNCVKEQHN